ncbi:hypothetical protein ES706_06417 [subsurface metagenome]
MSLRGEAVAISRLLRSLRSLAMTSDLRFLAENSNARYTKSPRIRGIGCLCFLAKIPKIFTNYLFS